MPLRDTLALVFIVFATSSRHLQTPSQTAEAPTADVTFYTSSEPSNTVKGWLPGYKHGTFAGGIFDGEHLLAQIQRRSFVTFTLPPGPHVFSASVEGWHPDKNSLLQINLVSKQSYFLRIDQESLAPPVVTLGPIAPVMPVPRFGKGIFTQATCTDARKENIKSKPLRQRFIWPDGLPLAVADPSFPLCS